MTINEQVALATDNVAHWNSKRDHAQALRAHKVRQPAR
jgi:hypothetical protein